MAGIAAGRLAEERRSWRKARRCVRQLRLLHADAAARNRRTTRTASWQSLAGALPAEALRTLRTVRRLMAVTRHAAAPPTAARTC
jgi:hypothetical protein